MITHVFDKTLGEKLSELSLNKVGTLFGIPVATASLPKDIYAVMTNGKGMIVVLRKEGTC